MILRIYKCSIRLLYILKFNGNFSAAGLKTWKCFFRNHAWINGSFWFLEIHNKRRCGNTEIKTVG